MQTTKENEQKAQLSQRQNACVRGHYAVQGYSRSLLLIPIESPYTTSYQWRILTYILPRKVFFIAQY